MPKPKGLEPGQQWCQPGSRMPLVPYDPELQAALRGTRSPRSDGQNECEIDVNGDYMSHFANCPGAAGFSRKKPRR